MKNLLLILTLTLFAQSTFAQSYNDGQFKVEKQTANLWHQIPFFSGGDIGQYQDTMAQNRDQVRQMFWRELMDDLLQLADKGAVVEKMLEPMANILLKFDQVHDIHKAKDIINIDFSLEQQFKGSFDNLFARYDIRDNKRKIQISRGTNADLLSAYIRGISKDRPFGESLSQTEIDVKKALEMYEQIDYVAYGTFSSLGRGQFQLTFHLTGNKNGVTRNFIARGGLVEAADALALQVFHFFQGNTYDQWEAPYSQLKWLPMPVNPERDRRITEMNDWGLYSFAEAKSYCQARGYRLPFAKELLMAETGTNYNDGGIQALYSYAKWAVADRRQTNENNWIIPANSDSTSGIFMSDALPPLKGVFWCVRGQVARDVALIDKIWSHIRNARNKNFDVYVALETLRFELGDYNSRPTDLIFWNGSFVNIKIYESVEEALDVLKKNNIQIDWP